LNNEQIAQSCRLATHAGVDFVKTSTGFAIHGVQEEKLAVMCKNFKGGIKISGGVNARNVTRFLSVISALQLEDFTLDPGKIRIGESQLLNQLAS